MMTSADVETTEEFHSRRETKQETDIRETTSASEATKMAPECEKGIS